MKSLLTHRDRGETSLLRISDAEQQINLLTSGDAKLRLDSNIRCTVPPLQARRCAELLIHYHFVGDFTDQETGCWGSLLFCLPNIPPSISSSNKTLLSCKDLILHVFSRANSGFASQNNPPPRDNTWFSDRHVTQTGQ